MSTPEVELFVVSHLDSLLSQIEAGDSIVPINLDRLEISSEFRGNHLAESRVFLSDVPLQAKAKVVGTLSARWGERFPSLPKLDDLPIPLSSLPPNSFFAPLITPISGRLGLKAWLMLQDVDHPGIANLLRPIFNMSNSKDSGNLPMRPKYGYAVLGGQIVLQRHEFLKLTEFMRSNIYRVVNEHGIHPPFKYACSDCGLKFTHGVGRWEDSRHLGFLAERFLASFFIIHPELVPTTVLGDEAIAVKAKNVLSAGLRLYYELVMTILLRARKRHFGKCMHSEQ
jgi:hypothetical protein